MHASTDFESFRDTVVDAASRGDSASVLAAIRPSAHALAGEHGTRFRELISGLPLEIWHNDPEVAAALGESYRANGSPRGQSALGYFRAAEDAIATTPGVPAHCVAAVLIGHTAALRALGQMAQAKGKADQACEIIKTQLTANMPMRIQLGARWALEQGMLQLHEGEFATARAHLEYAHGLAAHLTLPEHVEVLGALALLDSTEGELDRGLDHVHQARTLAEGTDLLESGYGAPALIAEVSIACERGDIERASAVAPEMLEAACRTEWEPGAYRAAAQVVAYQGDLIEALHGAERALQGFAGWEETAAIGRDFAELLRANILLALDHADESWAILKTIPVRETHPLCPARVIAQLRLAHGDIVGADEAIRACEVVGGAHNARTVVDIQLLRAAIEHTRGNFTASDVSADRAFASMARTGARAPLQRVHTSTLHALMQRAATRRQSDDVRGMLIALLQNTPDAPVDEVETLSVRERLVLAQVQRGLTVAAIASELYISPNTVKTHLRRLYRKLGVSTREEAIRAARSLGLDALGSEEQITRSSPAGQRDATESAVL